MTLQHDRPIVALSVFKSGTHLLRKVLTSITGMPSFEPPIVRGKVNYRDSKQLIFETGHYYSWHLIPNPEICGRLREARALPIFLMRNVCDVAVSMYHHFAQNIDADIGRGRGVQHHFDEMSQDEGLLAIIDGMMRPDFRWLGLAPHLEQMERMLEFAESYPCFVISFERLCSDKARMVRALASFLGASLSQGRLTEVCEATSFDQMKAEAEAEGRGSHYRQGQIGGAASVLTEVHIDSIARAMQTHAPRLRVLAAKAGVHETVELVHSGSGQG